MANQVASDHVSEVTEQLQSINVTGLVVDATGEPVIGASVVEKGQLMVLLLTLMESLH